MKLFLGLAKLLILGIISCCEDTHPILSPTDFIRCNKKGFNQSIFQIIYLDTCSCCDVTHPILSASGIIRRCMNQSISLLSIKIPVAAEKTHIQYSAHPAS